MSFLQVVKYLTTKKHIPLHIKVSKTAYPVPQGLSVGCSGAPWVLIGEQPVSEYPRYTKMGYRACNYRQ